MVTKTAYYEASASCQKIYIPFDTYKSYYSEGGWDGRKLQALYTFSASFLETIYHFAMVLIVGVPSFLTCNSKQLQAECYNIYKTIEKAFASVVTIFDDQRGCYYLDRSQFLKEKNICWIEKDQDFHTPPSKSLSSVAPQQQLSKQTPIYINPLEWLEQSLISTEPTVFSWITDYIDSPRASQHISSVRFTAHKLEALFRTLSLADPTELSSSCTLFMQDVQDTSHQALTCIQERQNIYLAITTFSEKIIHATHGSPNRQVRNNPFSSYVSPLVWNSMEVAIPQQSLRRILERPTHKTLITCKKVEASFFHAIYPQTVQKYVEKTGWFATHHVVKWMICDTAGWACAYALQAIKNSSGYEEDPLSSEESLIATQWYSKWAFWGIFLNFELKVWKASRSALSDNTAEEQEYSILRRDNIGNSSTPSLVERSLPYLMEIIGDNRPAAQINHSPPPPSIWSRIGNWLTSSK